MDGGQLKDDITAEDIYAVIGAVVARLLKPDENLFLHEIIGALHHHGQQSPERRVKNACLEAVRLLSRQLH